MTITEPNPTGLRTSEHIGGVGHSLRRREDDRFIQGVGRYLQLIPV